MNASVDEYNDAIIGRLCVFPIKEYFEQAHTALTSIILALSHT